MIKILKALFWIVLWIAMIVSTNLWPGPTLAVIIAYLVGEIMGMMGGLDKVMSKL